MIEIPEGKTLERQSLEILCGKQITNVIAASSPHKFCWYYGDPAGYSNLLTGKSITGAKGHGMFLDLYFDEVTLTIGDGTNIRYLKAGEKKPEKHQLLIELNGGDSLVFTVAMYGGIWTYSGSFESSYYQGSLNSIFPLSKEFDEEYFESLLKSVKKDLSAKAFLATEQRIPGLGNGVLQDILLVSGINPKRKISTFTDSEKNDLLYNLKAILGDMASNGGRDTEKDLFGNYGGYKTLLSKNTINYTDSDLIISGTHNISPVPRRIHPRLHNRCGSFLTVWYILGSCSKINSERSYHLSKRAVCRRLMCKTTHVNEILRFIPGNTA